MKSASSVNELGVGHARACEDEEATRRGRTRQRPWRATASLASSVARASGPNARGKAARNERPGGVGGGSPGRRRTDVRRLAGRGRGHLGNAAACGKPYARNGEKVTEFVEVEVRAYKRRCRRPRYRSTCSCAPKREVVAPPVPRLFANTGLSVWNWFLTETYALHRPLRSVPRQLSMLDFEVAPGTLGDSVRRFVPLFAPLGDAIAERSGQNSPW